MSWFKVVEDTPDHPKVLGLARDLEIHSHHALGMLVALWAWVNRFAPDGNLSSYEAGDIEWALRWDGDPGRLVAALINRRLLDFDGGELSVHNWGDHAEKNKNAERKRAQRARRKADSHARVTDVSRDSHAAVTPPSRLEETEETEETEVAPPAGSRRRDILSVWDHYLRYHPRARNTKITSKSKNWKLIADRLAEDFTPAQMCRAIDGLHAHPFNQGHNDRGTKYLELRHALESADKVTGRMEYAENGPEPEYRPPNQAERIADLAFAAREEEEKQQQLIGAQHEEIRSA